MTTCNTTRTLRMHIARFFCAALLATACDLLLAGALHCYGYGAQKETWYAYAATAEVGRDLGLEAPSRLEFTTADKFLQTLSKRLLAGAGKSHPESEGTLVRNVMASMHTATSEFGTMWVPLLC